MPESKILQLPSVLNEVREFFENNDIENVVAFIQTTDGVVHFLSTGFDINLLYLARKDITREMDRLIDESFETVDEDEED